MPQENTDLDLNTVFNKVLDCDNQEITMSILKHRIGETKEQFNLFKQSLILNYYSLLNKNLLYLFNETPDTPEKLFEFTQNFSLPTRFIDLLEAMSALKDFDSYCSQHKITKISDIKLLETETPL